MRKVVKQHHRQEGNADKCQMRCGIRCEQDLPASPEPSPGLWEIRTGKTFKFGGWCVSVIRGMEHICTRLSGRESLSHVSSHWAAHHYKEGIFIRIFQTKKLEFRKLKTMQPRTGKPETGSKVSDASNLLIASWEEPCGRLPSRLGSKFSWTDTGVRGLYLEELHSCRGAAGSKKHWVWGSLFSHPSIQTCRQKGVLEFSLNFKTHFPLLLVKTFGQKLKSGLVIHVFAVGL